MVYYCALLHTFNFFLGDGISKKEIYLILNFMQNVPRNDASVLRAQLHIGGPELGPSHHYRKSS